MNDLLPELLQKCRAGDRAAGDELVRRFEAHAASVARAFVVDPSDLADAVQNAFLTVLTHLHELRDPACFPGWLRQIVRREAQRSARHRERSATEEDRADDRIGDPLYSTALAELRERVRAALTSLPSHSRQTATLFYLEEMSHAEVAEQLGVPLGTVKRRLHDARRQLRGSLADQTSKPELPL